MCVLMLPFWCGRLGLGLSQEVLWLIKIALESILMSSQWRVLAAVPIAIDGLYAVDKGTNGEFGADSLRQVRSHHVR